MYGETKKDLVEIIKKLCEMKQVQLIDGKVCVDHVHMYVAIPPKMCVSEFMDCQHFFRQIFLGYFPDIVQAFDTLGRNVYGDDYTSLHNPIVLSSVLLVYGMFHSTRILF